MPTDTPAERPREGQPIIWDGASRQRWEEQERPKPKEHGPEWPVATEEAPPEKPQRQGPQEERVGVAKSSEPKKVRPTFKRLANVAYWIAVIFVAYLAIHHKQGETPAQTPEEMVASGLKSENAKDYKQAVSWYRKAAEAGNALGMFDLGVMYQYGRGVDKDYSQALSWYRKAADAGNALATTNLGVMYQYGYGVNKDYAQALSWYRKAATAGDPQGMSNLGTMYQNGYGVDRDYVQAVDWYRKAAEAGNARAMVALGIMYSNGLGVDKDDKQALSWYRKAADQGDADGQNGTAWIYATSSDPALRNPSAALDWARKAVKSTKEHPDPNILGTLAEAYDVNKRYQQAIATEERALAMAPQEQKADYQKYLDKYQRDLEGSK